MSPALRRRAWHPNVFDTIGVAILLMLSVASVAVVEAAASSTEVSEDEAVSAYRDQAAVPSPAAPVEPVPAPTAPTGPAPPAPPSPTAPGVSGSAPTEAPAPPAAAAQPAVFGPPAPGVYRYGTSGGESVNMPGASREYPPESTATVRHGEGCDWEFEHQVAREHVDQRRYCSQPGELLLLGGATRVTFFGQTDGTEFACDPPSVLLRLDDEPGTTHSGGCSGEGTTTSERITLVGREDVTVGGVTVPAYRLRVEATISGRAEGTSRSDVWVHPDSGLMLRAERQNDSVSNAFGREVRYREEVTFELLDLQPRI